MLPHLDVIFKIKIISGNKSVIAIKKKGSLCWSSFRSEDWPIERHSIYIQARVQGLSIKRENSRVSFRLSQENIAHYYDEQKEKFKFGIYELQDGLKRQTFKPGLDNPRLFLDNVFEHCFVGRPEEDMKYQLNRFIPKSDKVCFANDLLHKSYADVKEKFIHKYIHIHLAKKQEALSISLDAFPTIHHFIRQMQTNLKTFCPEIADEPGLCGALLRSLPATIQALIYISGNYNSVDRILNYVEILGNQSQFSKGPRASPDFDPDCPRNSFITTDTDTASATGSVSTRGTKRSKGPRAKPRKNLRAS